MADPSETLYPTPEAKIQAGLSGMRSVAIAVGKNYDLIGSWIHITKYYPAYAMENVAQKDVYTFNSFVNIVQGLLDGGNRESVAQADLLLRALAATITQIAPFSSLLSYDDAQDRFKTLLAQLTEFKGKMRIETNALRYAQDVPERLAFALATSSDSEEDAIIPLEVGVNTGIRTLQGKIEVTKSQVTGTFPLGSFPDVNPHSPLAEASRQNISIRLGDKVREVFGGIHDDSTRRSLEKKLGESFFLSELVSGILYSKDPLWQARLSYYGLATKEGISSEFREKILQDTILHVAFILQRQFKIKTTPGTVVEDNQTIPTLTCETRKAIYRVALRKFEHGSQLVITSIPASDQHTNTTERIDEGLKIINNALCGFAAYIDVPVIAPGIIVLPPELEKASKVDFVELTDSDLREDLEHIGGLPSITRDTIKNFVKGTIAYANGDQDAKPNSIILTGETGSGKTTICLAVAKEFYREGILVKKIAATERVMPQTLNKALQVFLHDAKGGVLIIDDLEDYFRGTPQEIKELRASLIRVLGELNSSQNHVIIFNTEHPEKVMGEREALLQTHRLDTVSCSLDVSNDGIEDVLKAVVARLLTQDPNFPVKKDDERVLLQLKRMAGEKGFADWLHEIQVVIQEYAETTVLTAGAITGAIKATGILEQATAKDFTTQLQRILEQKKLFRLAAQVAEEGRDLDEVRTELVRLTEILERQEERIGNLENQGAYKQTLASEEKTPENQPKKEKIPRIGRRE